MLKKKILIGSIALISVAPLAVGIVLGSKDTSDASDTVVITGDSATYKTLNKFNTADSLSSDTYLNLFQGSLFKQTPSGDSYALTKSLGITPRSEWEDSLQGIDNTDPKTWTGDFNPAKSTKDGYSIRQMTYDLAIDDIVHKDSKGLIKAESIALRGSKDGNYQKFWNGDLVTAEDFIETIKQFLDARNASPSAYKIWRNMDIKNAKKIWDAQINEGLSIDEAMEKYPLGVVGVGEPIKLEEVCDQNDPEAKAYYAEEYKKGNKLHNKIRYIFENDGTDFTNTYSLSTFTTPTNKRFLKSLASSKRGKELSSVDAQQGISKYATTVDSIMGSGPFKPEYMMYDYKIVAKKWLGYWDAKRTMSQKIEVRIINDPVTKTSMFLNGMLDSVQFKSQLLPQFSKPEIKRLVKKTAGLESTNFLSVNTDTKNKVNAKYLANDNFRQALQYAIDRKDLLTSLGSYYSMPGETFGTNQGNEDRMHEGVIQTIFSGKNDVGGVNKDSNSIIVDGEKRKLLTRDEIQITSQEGDKHENDDRVFNATLAKKFYEEFKKETPGYKGMNLSFLVPSENAENLVIIKQNIENVLPGVKITILPKPTSVFQTIQAQGEWDLAFINWSKTYYDSWNDYHIAFGKVVRKEGETDPMIAAGIDKVASSTSLNTFDFVIQKILQDPKFFKDELFEDDEAVAQLLRMSSAIGADNPSVTNKTYDESVWDTVPSKSNNFFGLKGSFEGLKTLKGIDTTDLPSKVKQFINNNSSSDKWTDDIYRYRVIYPLVEKLLRKSAYSISLYQLSDSYYATRQIGMAGGANTLINYQYIYSAVNIPKSNYTLPGEEILTKG